MHKKVLCLLLISGALFSDSAPAEVSFGDPVYGGSGCLEGNMSSTVSPDGSALSIIFDDYAVAAGGETYRRLTRKNCEMVIPVTLPRGLRVAVVGVDYRGFNSIPCGGQSTFEAEYFLGGGSTEPFKKVFYGPSDDEFLIENTIEADDLDWTECGGAENLRISSSMVIRTNNRLDEAEAVVDSADISNDGEMSPRGHTYYFTFESCGSDDDDDGSAYRG